MSARGWRKFSRSKPAPALAVSIAFHAMVAYAMSQTTWSAREVSPPPASVLWISDWRPFEPSTEPPAVVPPIERLPPPVPPEAEPPPEAEAPPSAELEEQPLNVEQEDAPAAEPSESGRSRTYLAPGVDWEREREMAIARVLEDLERQGTFSTDDPAEEEAAPNPREHLFDKPSRGSRGGKGAVLTPGQARSRFLNRLAELCNALTGGGIGFAFQGFSLGSACADAGPTADFFADLRPDALNSLPECAEPENLPALAIERRDEIPTIKCRLVLKEEEER